MWLGTCSWAYLPLPTTDEARIGSVGVTAAARTRAGRNSRPGMMAYMRAPATIQPMSMLREESRASAGLVQLDAPRARERGTHMGPSSMARSRQCRQTYALRGEESQPSARASAEARREDALGQLDADGEDRERDDDTGKLERELVRVVTCNATSSSV